MTTEKILTLMNDVKGGKINIDEAIAEIKKAIAEELCKKSGKNKILSSAKKILKNAESRYPFLRYAYVVDGKQYISDSYRVVEFSAPLPLEEVPKEFENKYPIQCFRDILNKAEKTGDLILPNVARLEIEIKARKKETNNNKLRTLYEFKPGKYVDALSLVEVVNCFEEKPEIEFKNSFMYFLSKNTRAALCPVRASNPVKVPIIKPEDLV